MTPLDQETTGACLTCGARELQGICVQGCPKCAHCGTPIAWADYEIMYRSPSDLRVAMICYGCYDANPDATTVFDMVRACELCGSDSSHCLVWGNDVEDDDAV